MKFLRGFDESKDLSKELQELCEGYLVYLTDLGVNIVIEKLNHGYIIYLESEDGVDYDDIKDNLIPFVEILKENWVLKYQAEFTIKYFDEEDDSYQEEYEYYPYAYLDVDFNDLIVCIKLVVEKK